MRYYVVIATLMDHSEEEGTFYENYPLLYDHCPSEDDLKQSLINRIMPMVEEKGSQEMLQDALGSNWSNMDLAKVTLEDKGSTWIEFAAVAWKLKFHIEKRLVNE